MTSRSLLITALALLVSVSACAGGETAVAPGPGPSSGFDGGDASSADVGGGHGFEVSVSEVDPDAPSKPDVQIDMGPDATTPACAAAEICGDGLDNDCNGKVDDGCVCQPGKVAPCYRGPASTRGVGLCADGKMTCVGATEFGAWGPCEGDVLPAAEKCDDAAQDENCNGAKNEGCECSSGSPPVPCGSDVGACKKGTQTCVDGKLGPCVGAVGPTAESCNNIDDDCDGEIDEGLTRSCGSAIGACKLGTETCKAGAWGVCTGGVMPTPEKCNGIDDDCNGVVDDVTEPCGSSVGACKPGVRKCIGGAFGACEGSVGPVAETCNGVDDDCNGIVDDGLVRTCGKDVGICKSGKETCSAGAWGACVGSVGPGVEVCDGKLDEDCDGAIDEGCTCITGATKACGSSVGACKPGTQTCDAAGAWGPCVGETAPAAEVCDGVDNDCDGAVDEGCGCIGGATRTCGSSVGACKPGVETCSLAGTWGPCMGGTGPSPEACNGIDDNCDGAIDEGGVCPKLPPTVTCPGSISATVGTPVSLSGTASDPDGGPLTYTWSVTTRPTGSTANPVPPTSATTSYTPDAVGSHVLSFCAKDDEGDERCCTTTINAGSSCTAPTNPGATTCGTSWDRRPIVEFAPVPTGVQYEVWKSGDATPLATITTVGQNYFRPASAIGVGGPPPGTPASLYVKACKTTDPTCCTTSALATTSLVESCTTPVAPTTTNVMFSEYIINGDGTPGTCPGPTCEAGEAIEITNLSHCPVTLAGHHFSYCSDTCTTQRWMNFGAGEIIPPRGVYVAIRNRPATTCTFPFLGAEDAGIFGLKISTLAMEGSGLDNGWFGNNVTTGSSSKLRIATGAYVNMTAGTTIAQVAPYKDTAPECSGIGFNAIDLCGDVSTTTPPSTTLTPSQLGRLWHPCDAVVAPVPASCK